MSKKTKKTEGIDKKRGSFTLALVVKGESEKLAGRGVKVETELSGIDEVLNIYGRKAAEGDIAVVLSKAAETALDKLFRPKKKVVNCRTKPKT